MEEPKFTKAILKGLGVLIAAYLFLPVLIFDFSKTVFPEEESSSRGNLIAIGPKLRGVGFADFSYFYTGEEWPYRMYPWVCEIHRKIKGYDRPD
ncbi:MAG: hypothetical protein KDN20_19300 [Verrucomicrobiae bacterium]|nr:hypothetical protein [Verrucomicrobiae bacterium]